MWKKLTLAVVCGGLLGACAHPMTQADDAMACRQQALNSAAISAGACDEIGQYIPVATQAQHPLQEASAAPAH